MSSASASSSPALHRGTALDACWRTTGRGARRYLKSSRSARRDRGAGEPTPPRPANAGYCGPRGTRFLDGPRPARHAGTANPSGAPQDFGSQHPGRLPKDSAFPGGPAAGREDGGDGSQTLLKQQRWSLPRRQGRSGSLTRTGKSPCRKRPAPASTRLSVPDHPPLVPRLPGDGFLLLALLLYAPVGFCLLVLRLFLGIHVFLVSCALPDSVLRRFRLGAQGGSGLGWAGLEAVQSQLPTSPGSWCGPCVRCWGSWPGRRTLDSGITA